MSDAQIIQEGRAELAERGRCSGGSILRTMGLERRRRRWRRGSLIDAAGLGDVVSALVKKVARIWHN
jgi:hypothetical protein